MPFGEDSHTHGAHDCPFTQKTQIYEKTFYSSSQTFFLPRPSFQGLSLPVVGSSSRITSPFSVALSSSPSSLMLSAFRHGIIYTFLFIINNLELTLPLPEGGEVSDHLQFLLNHNLFAVDNIDTVLRCAYLAALQVVDSAVEVDSVQLAVFNSDDAGRFAIDGEGAVLSLATL